MSILAWIIATSLLGGILSVTAAALFALNARGQYLGGLVSYAIGALLGAVFLDILPEAIQSTPNVAAVSGTVLLGILLFFTLEKVLIWRHCHHEHCEAHEPHEHGANDHGRSGTMVIVGDTFHNFIDGIIIAAAFLVDVHLGVVTALAIIAHEIPQEVGDFAVLLHSGYSKVRAFQLNLISSFATLVGGVLGYVALQDMQIAGAVSAGPGGVQHDLCRGGRSDSRPAQTHPDARYRAASGVDPAGRGYGRLSSAHIVPE